MREKEKRAALNNKVVMITGASSGLGEALAHTFYRCGCKIILVARRKEELERVKKDLTDISAAVTHVPIILSLDLTENESLRDKVTKIINVYDRIDILINNAGVSHRGTVSDTDIEVHKKLMFVNYFSQLALNNIVLPYMIKQNSGHIVSISSVQGRIAIPYRSAYAASKHALQAWYDCARAELHDKNIYFTVVNPGYIKTSLSYNALTGGGQVYGVMDATTENGYEPEYVAECILRSVLEQEKEITIAPFTSKAAIVLRTLFPSVYFYIMKQRAKKGAKQHSQ